MPPELCKITHIRDSTLCNWSGVIYLFSGIAAAWNADTQQGTHGSRGVIEGRPKRKSEMQRPLPHGA
jgi:hypothetical protein